MALKIFAIRVFICRREIFDFFSFESIIFCNESFSKNVTQSQYNDNHRIDKIELYGWTTTSEISNWFGTTEKELRNFPGNSSLIISKIRDPDPDPVPPMVE
mmetsp:Transcript_128147/g.190959  ORF Transcript_128147/g.190959 Transcript_128147/m.190959 type:complete len:101 (+) Transcript_128147:730-1032(+)